VLCKSTHPLGTLGIGKSRLYYSVFFRLPLTDFLSDTPRAQASAPCDWSVELMHANEVSRIGYFLVQPQESTARGRRHWALTIIRIVLSRRNVGYAAGIAPPYPPKYHHIHPLSPRLFVSLHKLATDFSHKMQIENPVKLYYNSVTETIKYT